MSSVPLGWRGWVTERTRSSKALVTTGVKAFVSSFAMCWIVLESL